MIGIKVGWEGVEGCVVVYELVRESRAAGSFLGLSSSSVKSIVSTWQGAPNGISLSEASI